MLNIARLDQHLWFPPVTQALTEPCGLLAWGGDLSPERLLLAYRQGIFPWFNAGEPPLWWSPDPRMVLFPDAMKVSRSLNRILRQAVFQVSFDQCFAQVIHQCAALRSQTGTWISPQMQAAYIQLHQQGYAHSVEVWQAGQLVGGLYGVLLPPVFFGESMFSQASNASKVALVHLVRRLQQLGIEIIDCQVYSDHLASLGACEIPRSRFAEYLPRQATCLSLTSEASA